MITTACIDGSTECVRRLLSAGASPVPPDAWGRDPAAVARQLDRAGPLRLLEAATGASSAGKSKKVNGVDEGHGSSRSGDEGRTSSLPKMPEPPPLGADNVRRDRGFIGDGDVSGGDEEAISRSGAGHVSDGGDANTRADPTKTRVLSGSRWVVMNENGRMLERASGKVRELAA